MPFDQTPPIQAERGPEWEMPSIMDVQIRRARFTPRAPRHFDSPLAAVEDAVEITVTVDGAIPIRALSPVLWVGSQVLTESEAVGTDGRTLRFWAVDQARLRDGAAMSLAWMTDPPPTVRDTDRRFTYRAPQPR